jgi:hypothetical protein
MTDLNIVGTTGDLTSVSSTPSTGVEAPDSTQDFAHASQAWDASLGSGHPGPHSSDVDDDRPIKQGSQPDGSTIQTKKLRDVLSDAQDVLQQNYRLASQTTDDFVHDNPWQAVAIAALSGLAIGVLARR